MNDDYAPLPTPPPSHAAPSSSSSVRSMLREPLGGAFAGIVGTALGYPFDSVKTRMQTSGGVSISTAVRSILDENGVRGLYKGMTSPLLALTILNTMNFSSYAYFCKILNVSPSTKAQEGNTSRDRENISGFEWRYGCAASLVGPLASTVSTPFELIKTQMQLLKKHIVEGKAPEGAKKVTGSFTMAKYLVGQYGWTSLYRGHVVNTLREMIFLSAYFTVYEHSRLIIQSTLGISETLAIPIAGGLSGALGWFVSFPLDNIKSNIQGSPFTTNAKSTQSFITVGRELFKKRGILGLYNGVAPSIMRAFIVSASRFSAYEAAISVLDD